MPEYVDYTTVPHLAAVELGTAGMEWPAASGPFTVTMEHLADIVVAANEDPHVQAPRIKLGHNSAVNGDHPDYQPFAALDQAVPAFGRAMNLRTVNDGAVLVGDLAEVPKWLAEAMPSAYPNRSCEWVRDVETPGGKRYSMVITAVALLGPILPAIGDLEDLERFIEAGPEAITTEEGRVPASAATSVSWETIRERFNFEWAMDPESVFEGADGESLDPYWWWARDIRLDPAEVIADDEQGNLWSVPFTTDGADAVDFGEPVRVREVYVPVNTAGGEGMHRTAVPRAGQRVLATNLDRPEKDERQGAASAAEEATEEEATVPTITPEQLARLRGLPEDATEEQISSALEGETPEQPVPERETPGGEPEPEEEPEPEPTAVSEAPVATERGVTVDRDAFSQLQSDAAAGREARDRQLASERAGLIETAVGRGKFPRSAAASYRAQLDKGGQIEAQTRQFIEGLPDGTIPVDEIGTESDGTSDSAATTGWFPALATKEA